MSYFYATNCEDKFIANIMDVTLNLFFEIQNMDGSTGETDTVILFT